LASFCDGAVISEDHVLWQIERGAGPTTGEQPGEKEQFPSIRGDFANIREGKGKIDGIVEI